MKRHINFGSIEQFRNVVNNVQRSARFIGLSEDGAPIYDESIIAPTFTAIGTEKIHGSNAAVSFSNPDGLWVQSRENIITPEKDNAGCAFFVETRKDYFMKIINILSKEYSIDLDSNIISIYFEFCGGNIQKKAAVTGLDKMAILFKHFKVSPIEPSETESSKWFQTKIELKGTSIWIDAPEQRIFNICNFPTLTMEIDFQNPENAYKEMLRLTEEIETNSGVAKYFNKPENIGEGIVWTFLDDKGNLQRFKTKGEKHSVTKVKTLKPVDSEKEQIKIDFANYACPAWRLEQMFQKIQEEFKEPDMPHLGAFIKKVVNDVIKEESDIMAERGLEPKEVNPYISKVARLWYIEQI